MCSSDLVLSFVLSLVFVLFAASSLFYADISSITPQSELLAQGIQTTTGDVLMMGVVYIFLSFLFYYIGRGLLRFENRARITLLGVVILFLGMIVYASFNQEIFLKYTVLFVAIVGIDIIWYLTKKDTVKKFK